ncbi:uncharacterized protein LOC128206614 [Mya arenaria]|uniref:uncharacterized protein LOC128206614 n=1 Tax=Mya arenaria TaxID=6604 RepID=UPI0022E93C5E|nr:uncharacterized protein LOC128206614 [Mya arenaria]
METIVIGMWRLCAVLCVLLPMVLAATVHPPLLGGGLDGTAGRILLTGTPDTRKLVEGTHCVNRGDGVFDIVLYVHENDVNFRFKNIAGATSGPIAYECKMADYDNLRTNQDKVVVLADSTTSCPNSSPSLSRDAATRTHSITFSNFLEGSTADMAHDCGSYVGTASKHVYLLVSCKRNFLSDHAFELNVAYEIDIDDCNDPTLEVGPLEFTTPAKSYVERTYETEFRLYRTRDFRKVDDLNAKFVTDKVLKSLDVDWLREKGESPGIENVDLGEAIYAEGCISEIGGTHFFQDGVSIMGMKFKNCEFQTDDDVMDGRISSKRVMDACGCGLGTLPAKQWSTDKYVFKYGVGGPLDELPYLESPNCFRTEIISTAGFAFKNFGSNSDFTMSLVCDVDYCDSSSDGTCFGNVVKSTSAYPTCPCSRRRRRDEEEADTPPPFNLPRTLKTTFRVIVNKTEQPSNIWSEKEIINVNCDSTGFSTTAISVEAMVMLVLGFLSILMMIRLRFLAQSISYKRFTDVKSLSF